MIADIDDCVLSPCQNDGICTNGVNEFTCQCVPGFSRINCKTSKDLNTQQDKTGISVKYSFF